MNRVIFLIDGFNLYHSLIDELNKFPPRYKWLDLSKLANCFITKKDLIVDILYFTAYAVWNEQKVARHKRYIRALESRKVKTILGNYRPVKKKCRGSCKEVYSTYEEKQTDVNIAITLFELACKDAFDIANIVSADSDLSPAIKLVKRDFPQKRVNVIFPKRRYSESLRQIADSRIHIKEHHIKSSLFSDHVTVDKDVVLGCPDEWK